MASMPSMSSSARALRAHLGPWLLWWVGSMLLWLLLTSTIDKAEAVVGSGASIVAATAAEAVRSSGPFGFRPRASWLVRAWRIPIRIATETGQAFLVLWNHLTRRRRVRGAYRVIPFRHGGTGPTDGARRAVATIAVSVSPNTFVIGFDREDDVMLVHQLKPDPGQAKTLLEGS
jgi:multisubunit Na+/H+ antiporter MnhE subunit